MKATYNKSRLMHRAWYLFKQGVNGTFSYCLKKVWKEMKEWAAEQMQKAINDAKPKYQGSNFMPSAETMATYYQSNAYKGD